jgi:hypothetical protein
MSDMKQNIRYLGFKNTSDGGRRFDFSITAAGKSATQVSMDIPGGMFTGTQRITFQESAKICYEKLRLMLASEKAISGSLQILLTIDDIQRFRHIPRGRARYPSA